MSSPSHPLPVFTAPTETEDGLFSRRWRWLGLVLLLATVALRILFVLHYRIDSDEPQHLHVVWGWTHNYVQYRDVFDNHTPLFHLACIPLLEWVGERADALIWMRFAMAPLYFLVLWCVYRLGVVIHSREAGFWGALFAGLSPAMCFTATEYRTDDLWAAFWLASLVVLLGGQITWKRGLIVGLLFGAAIATSLKTLALLGCLGFAAIIGLLLRGNFRPVLKEGKSYAFLFALLVGAAIVPGLLALWFAHLNALPDALFGIFDYNAVPGLGRMSTQRACILGIVELCGAIGLLIPLSARLATRLIEPRRHLAFHLIFLGSGIYGALIYTVWPLLDAEHLIPFQPLFVLGWMPLLVHILSRHGSSASANIRRPVLAGAALVIMAAEAWTVRVNAANWTTQHLADLLRLSNPSDYVMDLKGETIFRPRPCWYLFEGVGIARARSGLMPDDVPEQMIETKTCITVHPNYRFISPRTLAFMDENYISTNGYRVLGHAMKPVAGTNNVFTFQVVIPETFAFISKNRKIGGMLDGQRCHGFATLTKGVHTFTPKWESSDVAFVWKQAIDRGFYPRERNQKQPAGRLPKFGPLST